MDELREGVLLQQLTLDRAAASSDSQPIIIEDGDGAGAAGGGLTKDDDATESEEEKMPESSTDTDCQTELPLSTELTAKLPLSAFVGGIPLLDSESVPVWIH
eukprot:1260764-Rhodomonas_salina.1